MSTQLMLNFIIQSNVVVAKVQRRQLAKDNIFSAAAVAIAKGHLLLQLTILNGVFVCQMIACEVGQFSRSSLLLFFTLFHLTDASLNLCVGLMFILRSSGLVSSFRQLSSYKRLFAPSNSRD